MHRLRPVGHYYASRLGSNLEAKMGNKAWWSDANKLTAYGLIATAIVGSVAFYLQARALPARVDSIEQKMTLRIDAMDQKIISNDLTVAKHCSKQEQFETDLVGRLERIERKIDGLKK